MMRLVLALVLSGTLFGMTPLLMAQGRGARGGGGQAGRGGPPSGGAQAGMMRGTGSGDRDQIRQRDRIHATDAQRDQVRDCIRSADRTRAQAKDMQKLAKSRRFDQQAAVQQRDKLQEQLRTMDRNHERLMQGFSAQQRAMEQQRIRTMEQARQRANARLEEMNGELGQAAPDPKRLQEQAREMERSMQQWREEYQEMAFEMEP